MSRGYPSGLGVTAKVATLVKPATLSPFAGATGGGGFKIPSPPKGAIAAAALLLAVGYAAKLFSSREAGGENLTVSPGGSGVNPGLVYWGPRFGQYWDDYPASSTWPMLTYNTGVSAQYIANATATYPIPTTPPQGQFKPPSRIGVGETPPADFFNGSTAITVPPGKWYCQYVEVRREQYNTTPRYWYEAHIEIYYNPASEDAKPSIVTLPPVAAWQTGVGSSRHWRRSAPVMSVGAAVGDEGRPSGGVAPPLPPPLTDKDYDIIRGGGVVAGDPAGTVPGVTVPGLSTGPLSRGVGIDGSGSLTAVFGPGREVKGGATAATMEVIRKSISEIGRGTEVMRCFVFATGNTYRTRSGVEKAVPKWRWAEALYALSFPGDPPLGMQARRMVSRRRGDVLITPDGRLLNQDQVAKRFALCMAANHLQDAVVGAWARSVASMGADIGLTAGPFGPQSLLSAAGGAAPYQGAFTW
jgi:hypothetical protein